MQDRPTFGALRNQGLCHLCSVASTTQNFSENKFTNKKQLFGLWRKYLSNNFLLWENAYHRVFIHFSASWKKISKKNSMKKISIYENCMISIFGQPGLVMFRKMESGD